MALSHCFGDFFLAFFDDLGQSAALRHATRLLDAQNDLGHCLFSVFEPFADPLQLALCVPLDTDKVFENLGSESDCFSASF